MTTSSPALPARALRQVGAEVPPLRPFAHEAFTHRVVAIAALVRLIALTAGMFALLGHQVTPAVLTVIVLLGASSYVGVARLGRLPQVVVHHPVLAMADVLLVVLVVAVAGVDSPLVLTTYSTALIVGVVFSVPVAAVLTVVLVSGYTAAWQAAGATYGSLGFAVAVGTPLLYVGLTAVGLAVRAVHDEQVEVLRALAHSQSLRSGAEERARLAREMHDSLAKTLHGLALSASALPVWVTRDPGRAASSALGLAEDAERAAAEARAILDRMRADQPDRPLAQVLGERCDAFAREHGVVCEFSAAVVVDVPSDVRYECVAIVEEALRNAAAHADASHVTVTVRAQEDDVLVEIADNGVGFVPRADGSGPARRYGLRGMHERAAVAGGDLRVRSAPGAGTRVCLRLPRGGSA